MSLSASYISIPAIGMHKFKTEVSIEKCNTLLRINSVVPIHKECVIRWGLNMYVSVADCSVHKKWQ